ncbi:MAG TPA: hypothetical protein H9776_08035 [Candidatus Mediterraneibacter intestinipullorum]|nr:hypothetical protein [Candidatus Mediterraneibacter intestinipullorum]
MLPSVSQNMESSPIPVEIVSTPTMRAYAQHERTVAENEEPIYGLVALFPCFRLWPFLFWKFGTVSKDNLYYEWITGNQSSGSSAAAVDSLITTYWIGKGCTWDEDTYKSIFKQSIYYEKYLFEEAAKKS